MDQEEINDKLSGYISGNIQIDELSEIIDEWLFDLRQKPDFTTEQEILSNLELYIHEAREGYRSWDELYEYVLSIIERKFNEQYSTTIIFNTSANSESIIINRGAIPVKDYHPDHVFV